MSSTSNNNNNSNNNNDIWEVHKFGGTSVASSACYLTVANILHNEIILQNSQCDDDDDDDKTFRMCAVVSAMGGKPKVTDLLLDTVSYAAERNEEKVHQTLCLIEQKHENCVNELGLSLTLLTEIKQDISDICDLLKTVSLMKWRAKRIQELVSGYGELWSAKILAALMEHRYGNDCQTFQFVDARTIIVVQEDDDDDNNNNQSILWNESAAHLQTLLNKTSSNTTTHFVATGYVASNHNGVSTTLGRDGSDYSASIFGNLLSSRTITIWTDVDGVLSADPRRVPDAHVVPDVSFNEAMELAYYGAKVIHPKTMQPAIMSDPPIPIYIRNTFNSKFKGTRIYTSSLTHLDRDKCVCGFSTVEDICLFNVEGSGMVGVPGTARRLFGTLEQNGINQG